MNGQVIPDPRELDGLSIDLASQRYGSAVVASSDDFYTSATQLNRPDQARTMGPGEAVRAGANYIVVGRPIIAAPDPRGAAQAIADELAGARLGA